MSEDAPYVPSHPAHPGAPFGRTGAAAPSPEAAPSVPAPAAADALGAPRPDLRESVVEVLQRIYDPEIPVNIYDLGLVYGVDVTPAGEVEIQMTLTSPSCPVAETLPPEVEQKVRLVEGVRAVRVNLVWEPPWGKHLLSEAARLQLGMD